ncbi:MAG: hypothetical protein ACOYYF_15775 [Chloroflexota bacterium]|nr:hypothetical protein [Chloroflexota bacterium]MBI5704773.1 hypothetical protein [Chloroflexota bacterium]
MIRYYAMRLWIVHIVLIWSLLLSGCSSSTEPTTHEPETIGWGNLQITPGTIDNLCVEKSFEDLDPTGGQSKQDFSSGLGVGFLPQNASTANKIFPATFLLNANEQPTFNLIFLYPKGNKDALNLRLFVLLDERQLDNALPESGIYNDISLQPGDDKSITITIPPLSPGVHEVIAVSVPYPENEPDEYGGVTVIHQRITLIVGETPTPPFRTIDFTTLPAEGSFKHDDPAMALELTVKKDGIDVWNWPHPWLDIQENTPFTFYALGGHQDVTNLDAPEVEPLKSSFSAFLLFVDYQQVEIAPNQTSLYAKMDSDTAYARLPITLPPLPAGKHHILVLRIDTPGVPMCILWGNSDERILPNSVYGKLVGLNVLPEP